MATRSSLNVSLTAELEKFVQRRVLTGRYQTASEVVREGLRLLERQELDRDAALAALRAKLQRGVKQADRGHLIDPDATLKKIETLKARRRAAKA